MSRIKVLLFVFIILTFIASVFIFVFSGNNFLIRKWNITLDPPGFFDARQMAMASESYAKGYDPLVQNSQYKGGNRLNYPRIWHLLFALGINQSHTNLIGVITVLIFFIGLGLFWFSNKIDDLTCSILSVAFLSSSVMLGVERGN
ncbi:MAG: hypothetical protein HY758_09225, partial [Nitrospirae bacterium]|nr:hypothetical protein [Nitrospirota bacterium]